MSKKPIKEQKVKLGRFQFSLLLLLIALASISAATIAWFSIADNGRVHSMDMEITAGTGMRFDTASHSSFDQYVQTLSFDQISNQMISQKGFDMKKEPLIPVTTKDCNVFTLEDGTRVSDRSGSYLTFTLHFMAQDDMVIHLSSESEEGSQGTSISSSRANLDKAMRISFTSEGSTHIYDPGMGNTSSGQAIKTFGLPQAGSMVYNDHNALFALKANVDKEVICHVWLEGTDEACNDKLRGGDYKIALKFRGTDANNRLLDDKYSEKDNHYNEDPEYYTKRDETATDKEEKDNGFIAAMKEFWENIKEIFAKNK